MRKSTHPTLRAPLRGGDFVLQFSAWNYGVCTSLDRSDNPRDPPKSPLKRGTSSGSFEAQSGKSPPRRGARRVGWVDLRRSNKIDRI